MYRVGQMKKYTGGPICSMWTTSNGWRRTPSTASLKHGGFHSNMVGLTQTWWVAFFQSIHHIFWEGHLLRHGECNLNLILISNLCFHHQFLYASLLILSFSPFNVSYTRYLANDMQFFLTSPIIIFALWKHRTIGLSLLATLLVSLSSLFISVLESPQMLF